MKINYEFDTDSALDRQVLQILNKSLTFIETEPDAAKGKPAETATTTTKPENKKPKGKRKPKEKTKEQLEKLTVDTMIDYLKSRKEASVLECKVFAKLVIDEYQCSAEVTDILHKLDANNFAELKQITQFAGGLIKLVATKKVEAEAATTKPEESDDDLDIFS